jgi:hypothetical protein
MIGLDRTFVARALKALGTPPKEIANGMHHADYSAGDVAIAMRLSGLNAKEVSQALQAAKYQKDEIPGALAYAGYKK